MKKKYFSYAAPFLLLVLLVLSRKLPLGPNVSLLGSAFLMAGFLTRSHRWAFLVPFGALFVSDYFIGFYSGMPWVYGAFAASLLVGALIRRIQVLPILGASLLSSLVFFLVSNFGVWMGGTLYPKNLTGLGQCYLAAIPFYRNALAGDLVTALIAFSCLKGILRLQARQDAATAALNA